MNSPGVSFNFFNFYFHWSFEVYFWDDLEIVSKIKTKEMEGILRKYQEISELQKKYNSSYEEYQKYLKEGEEVYSISKVN